MCGPACGTSLMCVLCMFYVCDGISRQIRTRPGGLCASVRRKIQHRPIGSFRADKGELCRRSESRSVGRFGPFAPFGFRINRRAPRGQPLLLLLASSVTELCLLQAAEVPNSRKPFGSPKRIDTFNDKHNHSNRFTLLQCGS